ncbi:MAG: Ig-like domain-containing protein [Microcoleaceae cyanobacterium]
MAVDIYASSPTDGIETEEQKLYDLVNQYRVENGVPAIPLSKALTIVANRHAIDLSENLGTVTHSWSDAVYDSSNPNTYSTIWQAPQRLNTGYPGNGYENVAGYSGANITANQAFDLWKNSPSHNNTILSQGMWSDITWQALGVGLSEGYATLWFGEEVDPTSFPVPEVTDNIPPTVSTFGPLDNALSVPVNSNLIVNFSENIQKGSGNIIIKQAADDLILETIPITNSNVTINGNRLIINPAKNFPIAKDCYVEIANTAIQDLAGNNYAGIIGKTTWNFQTAPINGTAGADTLLGTARADVINGLASNDRISGQAGDDQINGGAGNDTLTGGLGADRFIYNTNATFTRTSVGVDTITDFAIGQNDKIVLDKTTFPRISSSRGLGFTIDAEFTTVNNNTAAAISGADIVYNTATGELFYNQNGTATGFGTGGKFAVLSNKPVLTENQFIIQA